MRPDSCSVLKYEVQLVTGGPIYNNVNQITDQILFERSDKSIVCQNIVQPPSGSGVPCNDYRVRFCCANSNPGPIRPVDSKFSDFIIELGVGFVYIWYVGALEWE